MVRTLLIVLAGGLAFACASPARADVFTARATVNQNIPPLLGGAPQPNVTRIQGTNLGGISLANQYTSAAPPTVGQRIRAITADQVPASTAYTVNGTVLTPGNFGANKVIVVGAYDLQVTSVVGSTVTVTAQTGFLGYFASPAGILFDPSNPITWGVSAATQVGNIKTLAAQQNVISSGAGFDGISAAAGSTNNIAANINNPGLNTGVVIFNDPADPLITITAPTPGPFNQMLIQNINEQAVVPATLPIDAVDIAALNIIAALLGQPANIGGTAFATGTGNTADPLQFNPTLNATFGDLTFQFSNSEVPAIQPLQETPPGSAIPEIDPSSIAGALTLLGGGLLYLTDRRRRRNAK